MWQAIMMVGRSLASAGARTLAFGADAVGMDSVSASLKSFSSSVISPVTERLFGEGLKNSAEKYVTQKLKSEAESVVTQDDQSARETAALGHSATAVRGKIIQMHPNHLTENPRLEGPVNVGSNEETHSGPNKQLENNHNKNWNAFLEKLGVDTESRGYRAAAKTGNVITALLEGAKTLAIYSDGDLQLVTAALGSVDRALNRTKQFTDDTKKLAEYRILENMRNTAAKVA